MWSTGVLGSYLRTIGIRTRLAHRAVDRTAHAATVHLMDSPHSHLPSGTMGIRASRMSRAVIIGVTMMLLIGTLLGLVRLWPAQAGVPHTELLAPGVELLDARVADVPQDADPSEGSTVSAVGLSSPIRDRTVDVEVTPDVLSGLHPGDRIRILSIADVEELQTDQDFQDTADGLDPGSTEQGSSGTGTDSGEESDPDATSHAAEDPSGGFTYFDHQRKLPLALLFLAYLVVVGVVARGRGIRAVAGLAIGVAVVVWFLLPAILSGESPLLVSLVAAGAMIFPSVFVAHGFSVRSATAVIGTFAGLAVTALVAVGTSRPTGMTGADDETAQLLFGTDPGISLAAVLLAGVLISGLGALNDVTITQASSVWELRAAAPDSSRRRIFTSAMRIGRDHIASTVYTLAYAYIGSALPILLLASVIDRSLLDTLASGEIATEVFRTLVASIGLVLAIPITTLVATILAGSATADGGAPPRGRSAAKVARTGKRSGGPGGADGSADSTDWIHHP